MRSDGIGREVLLELTRLQVHTVTELRRIQHQHLRHHKDDIPVEHGLRDITCLVCHVADDILLTVLFT